MACLQSIRALPLRQGEAEIIVVDDGKTLSDFPLADAIHVPQEQAGLSVARNTGISFARGQYIQFIDADDSLIPSAYESVLKEVRKGESDIVLFKMSTVPSPPSLNGNASLSRRPPILDKRQSRPFPPPFEGTREARSFPADSPTEGDVGRFAILSRSVPRRRTLHAAALPPSQHTRRTQPASLLLSSACRYHHQLKVCRTDT